MNLSVREMKETDIEQIVDYFTQSTPGYLLGMGADPDKLPGKRKWLGNIKRELPKKYEAKEIYYIIWLMDGIGVGHSNINQIDFGNEAYMHLHIWNSENRHKGTGLQFLMKSLPYYFKNFNLQKIISEPYALNAAPIKTLLKLGFDFKKEYETVPGPINLLQKVKRFELKRDKWMHSVNDASDGKFS